MIASQAHLPHSAHPAAPHRAPLAAALVFGGTVFAALLIASALNALSLDTLTLALAFALLVVTPGVLLLAEFPDSPDAGQPFERLRRALLRLHPPAAVAAIASLLLPAGAWATALAGVWFLFAIGLSLLGALRFFGRADRLQAAEMCIDAGLAYAVVGGVALVTTRAGLPFLGFHEPFPALTAVHFHYAGLFAPVFAGIAGRLAAARHPRAFAVVATGVIFGSALIGIGILASDMIETISVTLLSLALWGLAGLTLIDAVPQLRSPALKVTLALAASVLFVSMPLAILYALGDALDTPFITIPQMIETHGRLNAFGFGALGLLSWLAARPARQWREHPDARVLREQQDAPLTHTAASDEADLTVHTRERVLGVDPTGALFERAGDALLRYRFYPDNIISSVSTFGLENRGAQPGDRIVLRLHLLHPGALSIAYIRALVSVTQIIDTPRHKRLSYCTTGWHPVCGGCTADLVWRDDGAVVFSLRSVERPVWRLLRVPVVTRIFRRFLNRALDRAGLPWSNYPDGY